VAAVLLVLAALAAGGWALTGRSDGDQQVSAALPAGAPAPAAGPTTAGTAPGPVDDPGPPTTMPAPTPGDPAPATMARTARTAGVPRARPVTTATRSAPAPAAPPTGPTPPAPPAPEPPPTTPATTTTTTTTVLVAPRIAATTTTTFATPDGHVGEIWLRLATDVPGDHTVELRWGGFGRRFAVSGGAPVTYHFEKKDAVSGHPIRLYADFEVESAFGTGTPPGAISGREGWYETG
jgi:hypothetical protein